MCPITSRVLRLCETLVFCIIFLCFGKAFTQPAPERSTPFTAVKWLQENPYVMVENEWYLLVAVDGTEAKAIVDYCKKIKGSRWQKYFSEDFVEALTGMGKPPQQKVKLLLINDGKTFEKTLEMTTDNRRKVWTYNNENQLTTEGKTQQEIVADVQKNIADFVNIKGDSVYKFKSAKIEFTSTGSKLFAGKETYYIDDFGKTVVIVTDKPGVMEPEKTTMIWKNNQTTLINHYKKNYYTTPVRTKSSEPPVIAYSTAEQKKQGGYEKKANEKIAGKECEVYEHIKNKVTYFLWKGIDLKLINHSVGSTFYTREAISVEENITIPASLLQIPEDYRKQ